MKNKAMGKAGEKMLGAMVKSGSLLFRGVGKSLGYVESGFKGAVQGTVRMGSAVGGAVSGAVGGSARSMASSGSRGMGGMKGMFTGGLRKKHALNYTEIKARIATLENQIREGYLQVGKIGSGVDNKDQLFEVPEIREIVEKIQAFENQLNALKKYEAKLNDAEKKNASGDTVSFDDLAGMGAAGDKTHKRIKHAIEDALRKAKFHLQSDAIIFRKALYDLLDDETEIKRLAASELGKLGNKYAGAALKEALQYGDPQLQAELINSLVRLEDRDTFAICKDFVKHDYAAIRAASIRGLYKAGRNDSVPFLIEGLKDENVEVRNSSAMFLGWCDAPTAVPALLQAAADQDRRVKKSAILSLSNLRDEASVLPLIRLLTDSDEELRKTIVAALERITGGSVPFKGDVEELKTWWIAKMHEGALAASSPSSAAVPANSNDQQPHDVSPKPAPRKRIKTVEPGGAGSEGGGGAQ